MHASGSALSADPSRPRVWHVPQSKHDVNKFFERLDKEDPLGVSLDHPSAFHCPANASRLTLPDFRDASRLEGFRKGRGVVFFQHLRKAGGTAFCDLATRNMPGEAPLYFCMPDRRGSLITPPFKHQWLKVTRENGYRIAANEWDAITRSTLDIPVRVGSTTGWPIALPLLCEALSCSPVRLDLDVWPVLCRTWCWPRRCATPWTGGTASTASSTWSSATT